MRENRIVLKLHRRQLHIVQTRDIYVVHVQVLDVKWEWQFYRRSIAQAHVKSGLREVV